VWESHASHNKPPSLWDRFPIHIGIHDGTVMMWRACRCEVSAATTQGRFLKLFFGVLYSLHRGAAFANPVVNYDQCILYLN